MSARHFALTVTGPPQGQGRARITTVGGSPRAFTPAKTRDYARQVQTEWIAAGRPTLPGGPYRLTVTVFDARPPSHYTSTGALSAAGRRAPYPGKPDLDNVIKGVLDALVACGAIPDDRHLVDVAALKLWDDGTGARVVVGAMTYAANEDEQEAA